MIEVKVVIGNKFDFDSEETSRRLREAFDKVAIEQGVRKRSRGIYEFGEVFKGDSVTLKACERLAAEFIKSGLNQVMKGDVIVTDRDFVLRVIPMDIRIDHFDTDTVRWQPQGN